MPAHVANRRLRVARLGDDLEVGLGVEQHAQGVAHHRVVVGEDDRRRLDLRRVAGHILHASEVSGGKYSLSGMHVFM